MEPIYSEMFKLWKFSWDSYKNNLTAMQEQAEKMLELFFSQGQSLQEGARKNVKDILGTAQKAQAAYIQTMEEALRKIEDIVAKR
jgi:polyhydroxyalkanoate synthesis regulator phasin